MNIPVEWEHYCKNTAKEILREYAEQHLLTLPIPIEEIIKTHIGDAYFFVANKSMDFPEDISAFAQKDMEIGWLIVVNGKECIERQRFSSAHELGHIALIKNQESKVFCSTDKESWVEKLCDRFAGHILMPEEFVLEFYRAHPSPYLEDIAKTFRVSRQVAEIQLGLMGLSFERKFQT